MAQIIIEAGKVPRSAVDKLETLDWHGVSSSLKASRLETQEELLFQFEFKIQKKPMFQLQAVSQVGGVSSYSGEGQTFCPIHAFN